MSAYQRDLLVRIVATTVAAAAGYGITELAAITAWWALPIAAGVTAIRATAVSTATGAALTADVAERTGWTVFQAAVAVLPVEALGWPPEFMIVIMAAFAVVKGWLAKRTGDPNTAGTVQIPRHAAP